MKLFQRFASLFVLFCSYLFSQDVAASVDPVKNKTFVVVLDAGHGGKDSGNRGNGYYEKKIALNIVLQIGKILEKDPTIKVIYTRKKEVFVDLIKRARIANQSDANL